MTASFSRRPSLSPKPTNSCAEAASLVSNLRNEPLPVLSWQTGEIPDSQFDLTRALNEKAMRSHEAGKRETTGDDTE